MVQFEGFDNNNNLFSTLGSVCSTSARGAEHKTSERNSTVMIRFSAWGAYLLLVPQGRALVRDRALISFWRNRQICETKL